MKKTVEKEATKLCVGLPRGLLYYRYRVLWKTFFSALGVQVVVSPQTNKEIVERGAKAAIDEACLSTKIYLGHVQALMGKCDYILVPRIDNFGMQREMCTKFQALYDLVCNTFRGSSQKFISYNVDEHKKQTEERAFYALGAELGFSRKQTAEAYKKARKTAAEDWKRRLKEQEQLFKKEGLKIMVAAHSYVLDDAYIGRPVLDLLGQMGVTALRADLTDTKEALKQSLKVSPTLKWELNREIVGGIQICRDRIDGIVLLSAFPCGPDSMVNDIVMRRFSGIPILNLMLDNQSGTAGLETRLESFVDILNFKRGAL